MDLETETEPQEVESQDLNPVTNPKAQEALSRKHGNKAVILLPLDSGDIAIFDRSFQLYAIVDEAITYERLNALSNLFFTKLTSRAAEARFYGEPDEKQFAKDLKKARRAAPVTVEQGELLDIVF